MLRKKSKTSKLSPLPDLEAMHTYKIKAKAEL